MFGAALSAWKMAGLVLMITLGFFGCSLAGLVGGSDLRDGTQEFSVPMIDPGGRDPERDLMNSESNLNNSKANVNNATVEKILAEATAIVAQSKYDDPLYIHREINLESAGAFNQGMMFIVGCIVLFVIGFVIKGLFSGGNNGQTK